MRFIPLFAACFTKMQNMPWLVDVVSIASVIALMTTMNVCVSLNARTLQASSQDSMLPKFFGNNNRNGVPAFAALITSLFAMIVALFPKITLQIVNFGAIFNLFTIIITLISLIEARKTSESKQAAFKAPDRLQYNFYSNRWERFIPFYYCVLGVGFKRLLLSCIMG